MSHSDPPANPDASRTNESLLHFFTRSQTSKAEGNAAEGATPSQPQTPSPQSKEPTQAEPTGRRETRRLQSLRETLPIATHFFTNPKPEKKTPAEQSVDIPAQKKPRRNQTSEKKQIGSYGKLDDKSSSNGGQRARNSPGKKAAAEVDASQALLVLVRSGDRTQETVDGRVMQVGFKLRGADSKTGGIKANNTSVDPEKSVRNDGSISTDASPVKKDGADDQGKAHTRKGVEMINVESSPDNTPTKSSCSNQNATVSAPFVSMKGWLGIKEAVDKGKQSKNVPEYAEKSTSHYVEKADYVDSQDGISSINMFSGQYQPKLKGKPLIWDATHYPCPNYSTPETKYPAIRFLKEINYIMASSIPTSILANNQVSRVSPNHPKQDPNSALCQLAYPTSKMTTVLQHIVSANQDKGHFVHRILDRYRSQISMFGQTMPWTELYKPDQSVLFFDQSRTIRFMLDWLREWKLALDSSGNQHKSGKISNFVFRQYLEDDYDEFDLKYMDVSMKQQIEHRKEIHQPILILVGPSGCGKTDSVHICAKEAGFSVLEIPPCQARSGKQIMQHFQEATHSHSLQKKPASIFSNQYSQQQVDSKKDSKLLQISKKKALQPVKREEVHSLLLFEQADIAFESDQGFYAAIETLSKTSKVPIVITCEDRSRVPVASNCIVKKFPNQQHSTTSFLLSLMFLSNHIYANESDIKALIEYHNGDIRKCMNQLNFLTKRPKHYTSANPRTENDEDCVCLSPFFSFSFGLGSIKPKKSRKIDDFVAEHNSHSIYIPTDWNFLDICKTTPENQTKMNRFLSDISPNPPDFYFVNYLHYLDASTPTDTEIASATPNATSAELDSISSCLQKSMLACVLIADIISMTDVFDSQTFLKEVSCSSGKCASSLMKDMTCCLLVDSSALGFRAAKCHSQAKCEAIPMKHPKESPRYGTVISKVCNEVRGQSQKLSVIGECVDVFPYVCSIAQSEERRRCAQGGKRFRHYFSSSSPNIIDILNTPAINSRF